MGILLSGPVRFLQGENANKNIREEKINQTIQTIWNANAIRIVAGLRMKVIEEEDGILPLWFFLDKGRGFW